MDYLLTFEHTEYSYELNCHEGSKNICQDINSSQSQEQVEKTVEEILSRSVDSSRATSINLTQIEWCRDRGSCKNCVGRLWDGR